MSIILYDTPESRSQLYPLSLTRPIGLTRLGVFTLAEKWERLSGLQVSLVTATYCSDPGMSNNGKEEDRYLHMDATVIPTKELLAALAGHPSGTTFTHQGQLIGFVSGQVHPYPVTPPQSDRSLDLHDLVRLQHPWDLFKLNDASIRADANLLITGQIPEHILRQNTIFGKDNLYIGESVTMRACVIDAEHGPVYIADHAVVLEGSLIKGPVSIGEGAVVKMGTKLYPGTTIGPHCTVGGEVKNSIMMGYSNKAHDGYLGDAVIGEWCNLGAGTSNSNVKNNAGTVKMWEDASGELTEVGLKAGLIMGDHSRSAINTSFNTGTVVGVCCHVMSHGPTPKHIPSFSWGDERYDLDKALRDMDRWMQLKGHRLSDGQKAMFRHIYH